MSLPGPLITDVATRLINAGVFTAVGTNLFLTGRSAIPAGDGPFCSLAETGGAGLIRQHDDSTYGRPSLSVVVRATSAPAARTKARAAFEALNFRNVTLNTTFYLWVRPIQSEPYELPEDGQGRVRYAFSLEAMSTTAP